MKILLAKAGYTRNYGQTVPPLGLFYISGALKAGGYPDIKLFEADLHKDPEKKFLEELEIFRPDVVGISAITAEAISLHSLAKTAASFPRRPVIVAGGTHATVYLKDCASDPNLDFIVRGEGEATAVELVSAIEKKGGFGGIRGLSYRKDGAPVHNPDRELLMDLDSLPFPDWSLSDPDSYNKGIPHSPLLYTQRYMRILTSRGCPYKCVYCHNTHGKIFRKHSAGRVIAEAEELRNKCGVLNLEISDDIFNLDAERAKAILRGLREKTPDMSLFFSNGLRADLLDRELMDLMKEANTRFVCVAIETASPALQEKIGKRMDLAKLRENAAYLMKKKIFVNGFFMIGFPGETLKELFTTVKFLLGLPIHTFMMSYCLAYGGTKLAEWVPPEKRVDPMRDVSPYYSIWGFLNCSELKDYQLVTAKLLSNVFFYFFFPLRWYRIFRDLPYRNAAIFGLLFKKLLTRSVFPK